MKILTEFHIHFHIHYASLFSVIQVIMFTRAHHKQTENVYKFKLHIINIIFYSEDILCLFIALWLFWSQQLFHSQSDLFFSTICVF